jgi:hypothetical protein
VIVVVVVVVLRLRALDFDRLDHGGVASADGRRKGGQEKNGRSEIGTIHPLFPH